MAERGDLTRRSLSVVRRLAADPDRAHYGAELMRELDMPSGSLYPILDRLRRRGWLDSETEEIDPVQAGRPPRRYYRLTEEGRAAADELSREAIAELVRGAISYEDAARGILSRDIVEVRFRDDRHFRSC